ncbi:Disulfide-bond oxidoreductase YghU [Vibrio stylophorae]|uniref:Disulfide-bond oxidoreductase YghU n=1 Tax=Vibrio stylophorae TaxID=659351 RepID=A0ABN8DWK4_9VIBR|nr:glutathione-dependent disulfide-bond oxidoreductase [Vibrio stylophorae]CAH0535662.1 Disulfide-bond oxidoreductase YghU [Vibrio stylophorae]
MSTPYTPPKIWTPSEHGGQWASINQPQAGARFERELPIGDHALQLYSMGTPNGQKVTIMLEELLALGKAAEYDAHLIQIGEADQFSSGFVAANPNSKIPVLVNYGEEHPINVFESGHILLYLAEKFDALLPASPHEKAQVRNWLFWLQGAAPYLGGGFGHFYQYAPEKLAYPIDRFTMEIKRQLDLLDKQLEHNAYIAGHEYSIADIAIWPWYGNLVLGHIYDAAEFLQVDSYSHLQVWATKIAKRAAVTRGRIVNRTWGELWEQLPERHQASDIDAVLALKPTNFA